jgi:hypothetical protein
MRNACLSAFLRRIIKNKEGYYIDKQFITVLLEKSVSLFNFFEILTTFQQERDDLTSS